MPATPSKRSCVAISGRRGESLRRVGISSSTRSCAMAVMSIMTVANRPRSSRTASNSSISTVADCPRCTPPLTAAASMGSVRSPPISSCANCGHSGRWAIPRHFHPLVPGMDGLLAGPYAACEATGRFHFNDYVGRGVLTNSPVMGRVVGRGAVAVTEEPEAEGQQGSATPCFRSFGLCPRSGRVGWHRDHAADAR